MAGPYCSVTVDTQAPPMGPTQTMEELEKRLAALEKAMEEDAAGGVHGADLLGSSTESSGWGIFERCVSSLFFFFFFWWLLGC